ncbi:hypothetical protein L6164_008944 [Bauhinia variegata]|uniref:Uncharacterized protein n=1 Tax=Bauhinia variegata TaxID=167791 RepID=A0ACB9PHF7_BAUVA|nr:hypothetical protein L6164_008944 [Bauhinia variegata]
MSDRSQPHQVQVHTQGRHEGGLQHHKGHLYPPDYNNNQRSPSTSQVLALLAGLPVGGTLLALAGLTLLGTFIGLAVATPLFIIFSPVLVPATIVLGLAVAGFLTSGAAGLTGLSSFSWVMNYIRQTQGTMPDQLDHAKRKMADMAGYVGQKTKEVGQDIQTRAHDTKRTST